MKFITGKKLNLIMFGGIETEGKALLSTKASWLHCVLYRSCKINEIEKKID
jgi:hypothetical protein